MRRSEKRPSVAGNSECLGIGTNEGCAGRRSDHAGSLTATDGNKYEPVNWAYRPIDFMNVCKSRLVI